MLKNTLLFVAIALVPVIAGAANFNAFGGISSTEFDGDGNWDREYGFDFGVLYMRPLQQNLWLRTGAGIAQRNSDLVISGNNVISVDFTLLEIPVTAYYEITKMWAVFGGINFNLVLDDDDVTGAKSFVFNLPLGFRVNLSGPHSLEGFYEMGITDLASSSSGNFKVGSAMGVKYLYSFSL